MQAIDVLKKIEQALAYTSAEARQQLLKELGKVMPIHGEKTEIEGKISWSSDPKEQKIYSNISLKLSPCFPQEQKDFATAFTNLLQNASPDLLTEIYQAIDYLLSVAEKPYFLHISPTLLVGDTGIVRFYFLGTAKTEGIALENNLEKVA